MTRSEGLDRLDRAYERIVDLFTAWAGREDGIRAAFVIGSRARRDHAADEWSDLDVLVIASDDAHHVDEPAWLDALGEVWISFVERTPAGNGFERRVLFAGGLDVDFAFQTVGDVEWLLQNDPGVLAVAAGRGARVLVDKDSVAARLLRGDPAGMGEAAGAIVGGGVARPPRVPPDTAFLDLASDFWYHAVWTAKHLRRGELWWAKGACDGHLKDLLLRVLEWNATAEGRDAWFRGRFLEEWADPATVAGLRSAFAHYDEDEIWAALAKTMDLFSDVARRTAEALAVPYPQTVERRSRALVAELRSTHPARSG